MRLKNISVLALAIFVVISTSSLAIGAARGLQSESVPQSAATSQARAMGTVKAVMATDHPRRRFGSRGQCAGAASTRIVRVAPGQKDLKDADANRLAGCACRRSHPCPRQQPLPGEPFRPRPSSLMKQLDIAAKQQHEREDWQKRGVGGLVSAVDPAARSGYDFDGNSRREKRTF